ncbi:MAG: hypothetical protein BM564_11405 [Bacteroidetes bacterium MedPE-SWsnd-G2]|nr:MAG: hypothetical protein BM564_11405 [Bacteroidetes bacterium MedPE-SWsnd-G2]
MKRYPTAIIIVFLFLIAHAGYGQDQDISKAENNRGSIVISFSPSLGYVSKGADLDNLNDEGHFVPGIGLDIFYQFHPKWEIGTMIDYDLAHYVIPRKNDLERDGAFIISAMTTYSINDNWNLSAGVGLELERHENVGLLRFGIGYVINLHNNWFIPIDNTLDIKPDYEAWSMAVGIGKSF